MDRSASGIARNIRLAREGQADALNELLEAYRNYVRLLASTSLRRDVRAKADPSDVAQDTLLKVHRNFHQFRGTTEQEWIAWVRQILVHSLRDLHRKYQLAKREVGREQSLEAIVDRSSLMLQNLLRAPGVSPSSQAHREELSVMLSDALAELDEEHREVIVLRNLRELEWDEIGAQTGRTPDAARMLWTRALKRFSAVLKERMP
jgi:RNA polymerase sigma-70 factor (ECF subfamily)